jgi:hypothetical protein
MRIIVGAGPANAMHTDSENKEGSNQFSFFQFTASSFAFASLQCLPFSICSKDSDTTRICPVTKGPTGDSVLVLNAFAGWKSGSRRVVTDDMHRPRVTNKRMTVTGSHDKYSVSVSFLTTQNRGRHATHRFHETTRYNLS